ncbi:MAG TPA: class I SAM-dependent methyltransferase [Candidatus Methylomirabilis sp.]
MPDLRTLVHMLLPPLLVKGMQVIRDRFCRTREASLPCRELAKLFPGILDCRVEIPARQIRREGGMLPLAELLTLAAVCQWLRPRLALEIGTFKGASTLVMAMNMPPEANICTLDLPPGASQLTYALDIGSIAGQPYVVGEHFQCTPFADRIQQLYGDSAVWDFTPLQGRVDLVFVDGNHAYENVLADSRNAFRCLRPGGVILWDDYHPTYGPGVMRALAEVSEGAIHCVQGTRFAVYVAGRSADDGSRHG